MATKNKIIGISTACVIVIITSYTSISYADNTSVSSSGIENSASWDTFESLLSSVESDSWVSNDSWVTVDTSIPTPTLYDTPTDTESGINPEEISLTSAEPIAITNSVKEPNILEWIYQGNWIIKVGTTNVKVISKKLSKASKWDAIELEIKWTIQNFSIVSVKVNGAIVGFETVSITTEKPDAYQNGIFTITWVYSNSTIAIEVGDKTKVRKLTVKNATDYEWKKISLKIKWTINNFKVVSPITIVDSQTNWK